MPTPPCLGVDALGDCRQCPRLVPLGQRPERESGVQPDAIMEQRITSTLSVGTQHKHLAATLRRGVRTLLTLHVLLSVAAMPITM